MGIRAVHLAKPVYESMPYAYAGTGIVLMLLSYFDGRGFWSNFVAFVGLLAVIGGAVIFLKRRDYRQCRTHYDYRSLD
jgi:formate hydrogenlyase subunit 3/multisubunit Na+/H+ antiporter MnhD subunit